MYDGEFISKNDKLITLSKVNDLYSKIMSKKLSNSTIKKEQSTFKNYKTLLRS